MGCHRQVVAHPGLRRCRLFNQDLQSDMLSLSRCPWDGTLGRPPNASWHAWEQRGWDGCALASWGEDSPHRSQWVGDCGSSEWRALPSSWREQDCKRKRRNRRSNVHDGMKGKIMRKVLRGYAKDKSGNLILIGAMPVPFSKDKCSPNARRQKRHLVRQGATIFKKEIIR